MDKKQLFPVSYYFKIANAEKRDIIIGQNWKFYYNLEPKRWFYTSENGFYDFRTTADFENEPVWNVTVLPHGTLVLFI